MQVLYYAYPWKVLNVDDLANIKCVVIQKEVICIYERFKCCLPRRSPCQLSIAQEVPGEDSQKRCSGIKGKLTPSVQNSTMLYQKCLSCNQKPVWEKNKTLD